MKKNLFIADKYNEVLAHSRDNELEILNSERCGCFFCRSIYSARTVSDWIQEDRGGASAICPECGIDAVLGDASGYELTKPFLKSLNQAIFSNETMALDTSALITYSLRYLDHHIPHKPHTEELYVTYLRALSNKSDPEATLHLAQFYETGGEFHSPDLQQAFHLYKSKLLSANADALVRLGCLYLNPQLDRVSEKLAYECFAKAMALGSLEAVYYFADCYLTGIHVKEDVKFGFELLYRTFPEVYSEFLENQSNGYLFTQYAYHLGKCIVFGLGTEKDSARALRFFLYAKLGIETHTGLPIEKINNEGLAPLIKDIKEEMTRLSKETKASLSELLFDQDSFYESFCEFGDSCPNKTFHLVQYDPATGLLEFEVTYDKPIIILDTGSLSAVFRSGTIHWSFVDVSSFRGQEDFQFDRVGSPDAEHWSFYRGMDNGQESPIASLRFFDPAGGKEEEEPFYPVDFDEE